MPDINKVVYGLKNVNIFPLEDETGVTTPTYGEGFSLPGAVDLTLDADDAESIFYADDIKYHVTHSNNGYTGSAEFAKLNDEFKTKILGRTITTDGVEVETTTDRIREFGMNFQFDGDKHPNVITLFKVSVSRPGEKYHTKEENVDPQTATFDLTILPLNDARGTLKTRTPNGDPKETPKVPSEE